MLFIASIELLIRGKWRLASAETHTESGVVLLVFPLLAVLGSITAVIISFQMAGLTVTALSILIVIGIIYVVLRYIDRIYRVIGRRGSIIVTRVFAVLISTIAVQFIVWMEPRHSLAKKDLLIYLVIDFKSIDKA